MHSLPPSAVPHSELDTVGVVALVHTSSPMTSHDPAVLESSTAVEQQVAIDTVFLTDCEGEILAVKVWGGLKVRLGCSFSGMYI